MTMYRVGDVLKFESFGLNWAGIDENSVKGETVYLLCLGMVDLGSKSVDSSNKESFLFAPIYPRENKAELESGRALKFIKSRFPMFHEKAFLYFSLPVEVIHGNVLSSMRSEYMVTGCLNAETLRNVYLGYFANRPMTYEILRNIKRNFTSARIRNLPMPEE